MLSQFLLLLLGGLLGHLLTRQYNSFEERENDAHTLRLAVSEIAELETELLGRSEMTNRDEPVHLVSNKNIKLFLESKLAYLLPSEVRLDFQQISGKIEGLNADATQYHDRRLNDIVGPIFQEEARSCYQWLVDPREGVKKRILNALLYTTRSRYRCFGSPAREKDILKGRSEDEIAFLEMFLENPPGRFSSTTVKRFVK